MRSMLNVEAALGLWLLRNKKNWKKGVKGLIQKPQNPVEGLLMSWWALPWALHPPAPETPAEGCKQPELRAAQHPPAAGRAQKGWELPGGEGWEWRRQRCLEMGTVPGVLTRLMWRA